MEHCRSTMSPFVSIFMSRALWHITNTAACEYDDNTIWRAVKHKLDSSLKASLCEFVFTLDTVSSTFIELVAVFVEPNTNGFECRETILDSAGSILRILWSINDASSRTCTGRTSTTPSQARRHRSTIRMKNEFIPSMFTASRFPAGNGGILF